MHKIFGIKEYSEYRDRKGAYLIPFEDGLIRIVKIPRGLFLIGGGIEEGETDADCIARECAEETGYTVRIDEKIGSAETYTVHSLYGPFHPIQTYYTGKLLAKNTEPIEKDHELLMLPYSELKGKLFSQMQNWALDEAVKLLQRKER